MSGDAAAGLFPPQRRSSKITSEIGGLRAEPGSPEYRGSREYFLEEKLHLFVRKYKTEQYLKINVVCHTLSHK